MNISASVLLLRLSSVCHAPGGSKTDSGWSKTRLSRRHRFAETAPRWTPDEPQTCPKLVFHVRENALHGIPVH